MNEETIEDIIIIIYQDIWNPRIGEALTATKHKGQILCML